MLGLILIIIGTIILIGWGVSHIAVTKSVVDGFGDISQDNKYVITQEWVAEGVVQVLLGLFVIVISLRHGIGSAVSLDMAIGCTVILLALAILTQLTGAKTPVIPFKICPVVLTIVSVLYIAGNLV